MPRSWRGSRRRGKAAADAAAEEEERDIRGASLFANLERGSPRYDRLCAKFVEDEFAAAIGWRSQGGRRRGVAAVDARLARQSEDFNSRRGRVRGTPGRGIIHPELVGLIFGSAFASG